MYKCQIIRNLVDAETGKEFEYTDDDVSISPASKDVAAAKAEAEAYSEWNEHAARFMDVAQQSGKYPKWKKRSINKQEAHDLKFDEKPAVDIEDESIIIRVLVVSEDEAEEALEETEETEETTEEETDSETEAEAEETV